MRTLASALWVLVVLTRTAYGASIELGKEDALPDVIVGDPHHPENDILGAPITEEEVKAGLELKITVPEEDPISKSGYFQGDIMIDTRDHLAQIIEGDPTGQHSATSNRQLLWPGGKMYYVISASYSKYKSNAVTTNLGLPYDYDSIMHYGPNAFSRGTGPTIVPKQSGVYIGQRERLSTNDVKGINMLYQCSGPQPTTVPPTSACKDNNQHCAAWASAGYCSSKYLTTNCRKSCNVCESTGCTDEAQFCSDWAAKGECQKNPLFMKEKCRRSCNACGTPSSCQDTNVNCESWASQGECTRNPGFMRIGCRKSCGVC
ncbi:Zinc metalloproteinase nas-13 [Portunus trituberculatus]|uniref:Metalloendopeptidase n=1 Tax=Portunus trituberculatus TaxID=210409 RepID=A0A5B7DAN7_PORTR|nr:Zinc metalloproteinase nas-13 [Portunus trituberculatus]